MKIGKRFSQLTYKELFHYIDNDKKYTDFNTLGLYRGIFESDKLSVEQKIEVRDYANKKFGKTFEFLQLKDPFTYFNLVTLGMDLIRPNEDKLWDDIKKNQQKILKQKRIKHRNFGTYAKHNCGHDSCSMNGLMMKKGQDTYIAEMHFHDDKNSWSAKQKAERLSKQQNEPIETSEFDELL